MENRLPVISELLHHYKGLVKQLYHCCRNKRQDRVLYWRDKSELPEGIMDEGQGGWAVPIKYED